MLDEEGAAGGLRPRPVRLLGLGVATLALAAACSGAASKPGPAPSPAFSVRCLPPVPNIAQAYPADGATAVPTSAAAIVFALPQSVDPTVYALQLVAGGQTANGSRLGPPPSPLPSPIATLPPGYAYAAGSPPPLAPATTYRVQLDNTAVTCLGPQTTGTFSTR